jgi:hypothetical protein
MTYGRRLLLTLRCAQVPLIVGVALPFIGGIALAAVLGGGMDHRVLLFRAFLSAKIYTYALITVLLYGAPIYAFLAHTGRANWLTAALLGVAPGAGALLIGIYPSGGLADANVTVGPMVMACGVFVALVTHVLAREAATLSLSTRQTLRQVIRGSALPLSRVLVVGAILGQAWTFMLVRNAEPGTFGALGFLDGAARYVIPFLLAAFICALYSYLTTCKPRGAVRVVEMVGPVLVGIVLLMPAAYVLGVAFRMR